VVVVVVGGNGRRGDDGGDDVGGSARGEDGGDEAIGVGSALPRAPTLALRSRTTTLSAEGGGRIRKSP